MSQVTINAVSVSYGDRRVLDDISLDVPDGAILALLGASGSGKTTLLRSIAGFVDPATGTIRSGERTLVSAEGARTVSVVPEKRNLAMVFQHHAVWPHMSVADNVGYPLRRARVPAEDRRTRIRQALAAVDLADCADRRPDTLSGGQRQRVALARAIVARPAALLLDEPFSAVDEPLRAALRLTLRRLVDTEGLTVILVTHDRDEALALADRIAVLDRGRLAQVGSPRELLERPGSPEVARFLQDATILDGSIDVDGSFHLTDGPLRVPADRIDGGVPGPTRLALLPRGVHIATDSAASGPRAEVEATFFGRTGSTVVCRWLGHRVTVPADAAQVAGLQPGDPVDLRVDHAVAYAAGPGPERVAHPQTRRRVTTGR